MRGHRDIQNQEKESWVSSRLEGSSDLLGGGDGVAANLGWPCWVMKWGTTSLSFWSPAGASIGQTQPETKTHWSPLLRYRSISLFQTKLWIKVGKGFWRHKQETSGTMLHSSFFFFFLNWSIFALRCCVTFCCRAGHYWALNRLPYATQWVLTLCLLHIALCISLKLFYTPA